MIGDTRALAGPAGAIDRFHVRRDLLDTFRDVRRTATGDRPDLASAGGEFANDRGASTACRAQNHMQGCLWHGRSIRTRDRTALVAFEACCKRTG